MGYEDDDLFFDDMDDYYDDNDREWSYQRLLARQGVDCTCEYCGTRFVGMPDHGVCNRCADAIERGFDIG